METYPLQETDQQKPDTCPQCKASLEARSKYRTWCPQCNWNLQLPSEIIQPKTPLESFVLRMSQQHSAALFKDVTTTSPNDLKTRFSSAKFASFTVATLVYGVSLLVGGLGLFLILNYYWNPIVLLFALGLVGFSLFARPRLGKLPEFPSEPEQFSMLVNLINTISDSLGTSRISSIVLDESFGASFAEVGWRKKKVLRLGVPLLSILDAQEIVALIGHEVAHGVNGDPARGRYVGSAIQTLMRWRVALHPVELWEQGSGIAGLLGVPFRLLFWGLSELVNLIAILLMNFCGTIRNAVNI
jgi:Zn-dependent protease with chaperone function/ribosomal protein L37AE/L43A